MESIGEKLRKYLKSVVGRDGGLRPTRGTRLPMYLQSAYAIWHASLFGRDIVLALARHVDGDTSPRRLIKDLENIASATGSDRIAIVLPGLSARDRRRLIHANIPFIVPGRQLYLPMLCIDLRERFARPWFGRPTALTWASQIVLIRHLLHRDVEERSLSELAERIGYSAMTLTNVRAELLAAELTVEETRGRRKLIRFLGARRETWEQARPILRSPVKETHAFAQHPPSEALVAGLSALARSTMISDDPIPTWAVHRPVLAKQLAGGGSAGSHSTIEPTSYVQSWMYDPAKVASEFVDPLSLYLSLCDTADERVRIALDELVETVQWS